MDKIKRTLRNLSIKKTFVLYVIVFLVIAILVSLISIGGTKIVQNNINSKYYNYVEKINYKEFTVVNFKYSNKDYFIINICDFIQTWFPMFFLCTSIFIAAILFYKHKLDKPINILNKAAEQIVKDNLDFKVIYDSEDEMGKLCTSFEKMRSFVESNIKKMWKDIEERKKLNAVFSHDLRTPLTVLKGYINFFEQYLLKGNLSEEKILSSISIMSNNILRLEKYVNSMSKIQKLEDICVDYKIFQLQDLWRKIVEISNIMIRGKKIKIDFFNKVDKKYIQISADKYIIIEVFENIISNAIYYTKTKISITLNFDFTYLSIIVEDNGTGFLKDEIEKVDTPFFRGKKSSNDYNCGLGLNICKILLEKHNGILKVSNNTKEGACVIAMFKILN